MSDVTKLLGAFKYTHFPTILSPSLSRSYHQTTLTMNTSKPVPSKDLPPPRQRQAIRSVSPPLHNVSMRRFTHYIAFAATLVFALYVYRITQWKAEAGSWWNLALGKKPPAVENMQQAHANWNAAKGGSGGATGGSANVKTDFAANADVERRINELAVALGLPSKDLASAIAGAVREYVPPASMSSIAAHQTGSVQVHARGAVHH